MAKGAVEDTRLKAKDTKNIRSQGQPYQVQTLSRPKTGMLEAKDTGASVLQRKERSSNKFSRRSQKKKKKVFKQILQAISRGGKQKRSSQIFREVSGVFQQNFNGSKNSAVLEPRTGQFLRTGGLEPKARGLTFESKAKVFKMCPQG